MPHGEDRHHAGQGRQPEKGCRKCEGPPKTERFFKEEPSHRHIGLSGTAIEVSSGGITTPNYNWAWVPNYRPSSRVRKSILDKHAPGQRRQWRKAFGKLIAVAQPKSKRPGSRRAVLMVLISNGKSRLEAQTGIWQIGRARPVPGKCATDKAPGHGIRRRGGSGGEPRFHSGHRQGGPRFGSGKGCCDTLSA